VAEGAPFPPGSVGTKCLFNYKCVCIHVYIYVCICVCMCVYVCVCVCKYVCMHFIYKAQHMKAPQMKALPVQTVDE
jgi:hypothetical protein